MFGFSGTFALFHYSPPYLNYALWRRSGRQSILLEWKHVLLAEELTAERIAALIPALVSGSSPAKSCFLSVSSPRQGFRFVSLPSSSEEEIVSMVPLQIKKNSPYSPEELCIGYELLSVDNKGFSDVSVVFIDRQTVASLVEGLRLAGFQVEAVYPGTSAAAALAGAADGPLPAEAVIVSLDLPSVELSVVKDGRVRFHRVASIEPEDPQKKDKLVKQIMDTQAIYLSTAGPGPIKKLILAASSADAAVLVPFLEKALVIPVEAVTAQRLPLIMDAAVKEELDTAFNCSVGFLLRRGWPAMDLLPEDLKRKRGALRRQMAAGRRALLFFASAVILFSALRVHIAKQQSLMRFLDAQIRQASEESQVLAEMVQGLASFEERNAQRAKLLDTMASVAGAVPAGVTVEEIRFDRSSAQEFVLIGTSPKIDAALAFAQALKAQPAMAATDISITYATTRTSKGDELFRYEMVLAARRIKK